MQETRATTTTATAFVRVPPPLLQPAPPVAGSSRSPAVSRRAASHARRCVGGDDAHRGCRCAADATPCARYRRPAAPACRRAARRASSSAPAPTRLLAMSSPAPAPPPPPPPLSPTSRVFARDPVGVAMAVLGAVGACETAYLSVTKLFMSDAAVCATRGCSQVLNSAYANVFNIPLSLFGTVAYALAAYLAVRRVRRGASHRPAARDSCARHDGEDDDDDDDGGAADAETAHARAAAAAVDADPDAERQQQRQRRRRARQFDNDALLGVASAMATFSAYLMLILTFELRAACPWCIASAAISVALLALSAYESRGHARRAAAVGGASTLLAAAGSLGVYVSVQLGGGGAGGALAPAVPAELVRRPPPVTTQSSARTMALARRLRENGARMYGAYWCEHCLEQKEQFGADAFALIEYRECSKYGADSAMGLCRKRRIPGYPTWEIRGKLYPGEHSLAQLARIVGVDDLDALAAHAP